MAAPAGGWWERARKAESAEEGEAGNVPGRKRRVCLANRSEVGGEGRRCRARTLQWPGRGRFRVAGRGGAQVPGVGGAWKAA